MTCTKRIALQYRCVGCLDCRVGGCVFGNTRHVVFATTPNSFLHAIVFLLSADSTRITCQTTYTVIFFSKSATTTPRASCIRCDSVRERHKIEAGRVRQRNNRATDRIGYCYKQGFVPHSEEYFKSHRTLTAGLMSGELSMSPSTRSSLLSWKQPRYSASTSAPLPLVLMGAKVGSAGSGVGAGTGISGSTVGGATGVAGTGVGGATGITGSAIGEGEGGGSWSVGSPSSIPPVAVDSSKTTRFRDATRMETVTAARGERG